MLDKKIAEITPMSNEELDTILGARGEGVLATLTKDCYYNSLARWFGCC